MTLKSLSIPSAVLAITVAAAPAVAQQREHRGEAGRTPQAEQRRSENHDRGDRAQPRAQAAPAPTPAPAPRSEQRVEPRRSEVVPRVDGRRGDRNDVAVPRVGPRVERPIIVAPRYDYRPSYGYRAYGYRPWYGYRGYAPFQPYYFRPQYRIGFGLFIGYPIRYYAYPYPVPVYGYGAPYSEVYVGPNAQYGGVALFVTPPDGYVYVDGGYAGIVHDFDGSRQPLTLMPGVHHIEVTQNGFEPLAFDVTVQPGVVIPYQGSLRPY
jgi:hypothetical protein